jgi:hypothetical protein
MARRNPFVAAAGARPPVVAQRDAELGALVRHLHGREAGRRAAPVAVTGLTGMGKSVLAHEAARRARALGWDPVVVAAAAGSDLLVELARGAAATVVHRGRRHPPAAERGPVLLGRLRALARAAGGELPVDVAPHASDAGDARSVALEHLRALGEAALADGGGGGHVLLVDDVHLADPARRADALAIAAALADAASRCVVVLVGQPGAVDGTGVEVAEVALRRLDVAGVAEAVVAPAAAEGVRIDDGAVRAIARRCGGVPFFLQALAAATWPAERDEVHTPDVEAAVVAAERALARDFFGPVDAALDELERRVCRAVGGLGPGATFPAVAIALDDPHRFDPERSALHPVCERLVQRGVLHRRGEALRLSLPFFERYLRVPA